MKKTMKKQYYIRKRKNITNHKYKTTHQHGGLSTGSINKIEDEAEGLLSSDKTNEFSSSLMNSNMMMGQNYMDPNMMMGQNYVDPSMLYKIYGDPYKLNSLWDLAVQPITNILSELYNILKTGKIENPNELKTKLDNMANLIEDTDVKNLVLNYNSEIMNVYLNQIGPSIQIVKNLFSTPINHALRNLLTNMYIYLIDNIKMTIINKQNQLVYGVLNQPANIYYALEFLNNNVVNDPSNNDYNKHLYTQTFIQEGGNINKEKDNNNKNKKLQKELLNEINKSLQEYTQ
jgi:hypothetical protein